MLEARGAKPVPWHMLFLQGFCTVKLQIAGENLMVFSHLLYDSVLGFFNFFLSWKATDKAWFSFMFNFVVKNFGNISVNSGEILFLSASLTHKNMLAFKPDQTLKVP